MAAGVGVAIGASKNGAGQVNAADSGITASDGVFVIDFYDDTKLSSTSGTGLTSSNYSSFVKVYTGLTKTNVVTGVTTSGTVQYGKNGGLTVGSSSNNTNSVTFTIGSDYAVTKCTVYAATYETGRWKLGGNAADNQSSAVYSAKAAAITTTPLVWDNLNNLTSLAFTKDNNGNNQKRLTIHTIVCEYSTGGEDDPVAVTGVSLNKNSTSIVVGSTETLTATVSPSDATDKSVTWKSYSDSDCTVESSAVASVSSGVVTAVSAGTAYVQVKTTDGSFTATCTVTVTAPVYKEFEKITAVGDLEAGKKYVVGNEGGTIFMSSTQNSNNRGQTSASASNNKVTETASMEVLELDGSTDEWTLSATKEAGYLYAVSGNNYLKTQNSSFTWEISFSSGNAVIHHDFSGTDRIMRYNSTNSLFSCYTSGQNPITLWKEVSTDPSISFVSPTTTVAVGNTVTNTATTKNCGDSPTVTYSVTASNPSGCATVGASNGTVTGVSAGTATIQASVTVGQTAYTATYTITVEQPTLINSVTITGAPGSTVTTATIGDTVSLSASVSKVGDGTVTLTWTSSDESVATVTGNNTTATVKYVGNGSTTITATANYPAADQGSNSGTAIISISTLKGSSTTPLTVTEAWTIANGLSSGTNNGLLTYVTGLITGTPSVNSSNRGTFDITDGTKTIKAYSINDCEGSDSSKSNYIADGYTVVVTGAIINYSGTLEVGYASPISGSLISSTAPASISSIAVKTAPTKTAYKSGESFDPTGLVITATYSDDSTVDIAYSSFPESFSFNPSTITSAGNVEITYQNKTCYQAVTLITVTSVVSVASAPSEVNVGGTIDPDDVILNVTFSDSTSGTVKATNVTCNTSSAGTVTATATYSAATSEQKSATFTVSVVAGPDVYITLSDFASGSYSANDGGIEVDGIAFDVKDSYQNNGGIQMKASSGQFHNTDPLGQYITSIEVKVKTNSVNVYLGSQELTSNSGTQVVTVSSGDAVVITPNSNTYQYIRLGNGGTYDVVEYVKIWYAPFVPTVTLDESSFEFVETSSGEVVVHATATYFTNNSGVVFTASSNDQDVVANADISVSGSTVTIQKADINPGEVTITVTGTYSAASEVATASFTIDCDAANRNLLSIAKTSDSTDTVFTVGDTFTISGLVITGTFDAAPLTHEVTSECTFKLWDGSSETALTPGSTTLSTVGDFTVRISHVNSAAAETLTYTIRVNDVPTFSVADFDDLYEGAQVLIVSTSDAVAVGAYGSNIYGYESVTIDGQGEITAWGDALVFTVRVYGDRLAFEYDGNKYLGYNGSGNKAHEQAQLVGNEHAAWSFDDTHGLLSSTEGCYLQYNSQSPRFACYTGGQHDVSIYISSNSSKTSVLGAQTYANKYLHMRDYIDADGSCMNNSDNHYYSTAKTAYASLTSQEKTEFAGLTDAVARLQAWARANGEIFDPSAKTFSASPRVSLLNVMGKNTNTVAIIVIISMVSVTAIGGYFFLRKRKENI